MKKLILLIVVVLLLAGGWFFVSPLFIDETVDEAFDFVNADGSVDMTAVMSMPDDKRRSMMDDIMTTAAAAPDKAMSDPMPTEPVVIATGQFVDADAVHKGEGTADLYALPDGRNVIRFEDFRTTNGPALVVYLSKHASPKTASDVLDAGYLNLGDLKGNVGSQNYFIPEGTDVSEYNSVVIWCELFDVLFSPAALQRAT